MKKITLSVLVIAGLASATVQSAFASDTGWYALGQFGQSLNNSKSSFDNTARSAGGSGFSSSMNNPTAYSLSAGYQINQNLAIEGGYIASGNSNYLMSGGNFGGSSISDSFTGFDMKAVGILPLPNQFSLLGKIGVASLTQSGSTNFNSSVNGSKTGITYGIGGEYDFTDNIAVRLDWDSYNAGSTTLSTGSIVSSTRLNVLAVGVAYKF